jgi:hypothetical protein
MNLLGETALSVKQGTDMAQLFKISNTPGTLILRNGNLCLSIFVRPSGRQRNILKV